jgi:hypothetical protein
MPRHDFDALSFVFGLTFAGAGLILLGGSPSQGTLSLAWVGPVLACGLAVLVVIAVRPRRDHDGAEEAAADEPPI